MKKIVAFMLAFMMIFSCGCSVLSLNEEKDGQRVVGKIGDTTLYKKDFANYVKFFQVYYEANGSSVTTEEELDELKASLYDNYMFLYSVKQKVTDLGIVATAEADGFEYKTDSDVDELVASLVKGFGTEEAYNECLKKYGITDEALRATIKEVYELDDYLSILHGYGLEMIGIDKTTAVTIADNELPLGYVSWYGVNYILQYYISYYTLISDTSQILSLYETVQQQLAKMQAVIDYCKDNGINYTEAQYESAVEDASVLSLYFSESTLKDYYHQYFVSDETAEEALDFYATYYACIDALSDVLSAKIEYTEADVKTYYVDNISSYDERKVSAYHILTENEEFAKQLAEEAGGTAEGFMAVYEKYKDDAKVKEASDLGAFGRGKMVSEFEEASFNANKGDVVANVKTTYGYHLIYVYDVTGSVKTLEDAYDQIAKDYVDSKTSTQVSALTSTIEGNIKPTYASINQLPEGIFYDQLKEEYSIKFYEKVALAK